jgi:hypothetical protein
MSTSTMAPTTVVGRTIQKFPAAPNASILTEEMLPTGIKGRDLIRYAMLDKRIKRMSKEHGVLNTLIKQVFTKIGVFQFENVIIRRTQSVSVGFNTAAAERAYPREKFPELYTTVYALDRDALAAVAGKRMARFTTATPTQKLSVEVIDAKVVEPTKE